VIEVSDRGSDEQPRYAIVDGQHRYAAAKLRDPNAVLVANIHTGLTARDEAHLFYEIDADAPQLVVDAIARTLTPHPHSSRTYPIDTSKVLEAI
jgi:hypothetical protein